MSFCTICNRATRVECGGCYDKVASERDALRTAIAAAEARATEAERQLDEAIGAQYVDPRHRFTLWKDRAWETEQDKRAFRAERDALRVEVARVTKKRDALRADVERLTKELSEVQRLPDECDACAAKPGAPDLCRMCLAVRALKSARPTTDGERLRKAIGVLREVARVSALAAKTLEELDG